MWMFFMRFSCAVSPLLRRPPAYPTDVSRQVCGFCDEINLSLLHCLPPRRPLEFRWACGWVMCARADGCDMNSQLRHALLPVDDAQHWRICWVSEDGIFPIVSALCFRMFKRSERYVVRRCCPRDEFFLDLVERGSEMPDFDGHDLFCHFK